MLDPWGAWLGACKRWSCQRVVLQRWPSLSNAAAFLHRTAVQFSCTYGKTTSHSWCSQERAGDCPMRGRVVQFCSSICQLAGCHLLDFIGHLEKHGMVDFMRGCSCATNGQQPAGILAGISVHVCKHSRHAHSCCDPFSAWSAAWPRHLRVEGLLAGHQAGCHRVRSVSQVL